MTALNQLKPLSASEKGGMKWRIHAAHRRLASSPGRLPGARLPVGLFLVVSGLWFVIGAASPADEIRNVTRSSSFNDLAAALAAARDGDTLEVSGGPHVGNFVIAHRLTLRGGQEMPILDGGGKGSVLEIRADDVVVQGFALKNSGRSDSAFSQWGDAGIAVHGARAKLSELQVSGNDWGVLFFGGSGSSIDDSIVSDNSNDGIRIMGGSDHRVAGNTVHRNGTGISIDTYYPDREAPILTYGNPAVVKDYVDKKAKAPVATGNVVRGNEVRGNAFYGIVLTSECHHNRVEANEVFRTGEERPIDESKISAWESALGNISGVAVSFDHEPYGSGILLACLATENVVVGNNVHDNTAHGIVLNLADRNQISGNRVGSNRVGLYLVGADENTLIRNRVSGNTEYGVRIGSDDLFKQAPTGNLVVTNALAGNAVNAFDTSGRELKAADIEGILDRLPLPGAVKNQLAGNPALRAQMVKAYLSNLEPGSNRWDNGKTGNYHDDFDSAPEGFVDKDGNEISEAAKPIPGGPGIDHFPLSSKSIEVLLADPDH